MLLQSENLQKLTNEELVLLIQNFEDDGSYDSYINKELCWDILYAKTENMIHNVFKNDVSERFKTPEYKDDVYMTLKAGWVKAVYKYDISKDKKGTYFASFAKYLMCQEYYRKFVKRITKHKNGVSVHEELINSIKLNSDQITSQNNNIATAKGTLCDIIQIDTSSLIEFERIELKDIIQKKLNQLKEEMPFSYDLIIEYIFNGKTQVVIANEKNLRQTGVSKTIREGLNCLKGMFTEEEKRILLEEREW